jgi:hypothetical protein
VYLKQLSPYTLTGFDLTIHSSSLLGGKAELAGQLCVYVHNILFCERIYLHSLIFWGCDIFKKVNKIKMAQNGENSTNLVTLRAISNLSQVAVCMYVGSFFK